MSEQDNFDEAPTAGHNESAELVRGTEPAPSVRSEGPGSGVRSTGVGEFIGPYRLLEQIGEGGFGVVYLAERREPMVQRVALKILKPGMDSRIVIARFEQERQALALMDHANVAKVFDAGETEQGRPYFVMEYVAGEPITAYCDRQRLTIRERLKLFELVCDAVQHAHMKGVIHRDLKPSNILVVAGQTGPARPVVIDFGVAKAVSVRLTDKTVHTEHGVLIGTPDYMSPEQAEMNESDIDTRSDVYALGVVLYELLTGALPFDPKALRAAGFWAIHHTIREVEPPRPSTRLSEMGPEGAKAAQARRAERGDLAAILRGELEWIPLKAMRKDRAERYRSAAELGDDIANYLASRPLLAGPESTGYRFRKFVRRHRAAVGVSAVIAALLVAGAAGTAWGLVRAVAAERAERNLRGLAEEARNSAIAERARAEKDRDRALRVSGFMRDVFEGAGPVISGSRDTSLLKELMDSAAARITRGELRDVPGAELDLRLTIGGVYMDLAEFESAKTMIETASPVAEDRDRPNQQDDPRASTRVLRERARLLLLTGHAAEAQPLAEQALQVSRAAGTGDEAGIADSLMMVALCQKAQGKLRDAEPNYREALEIRQRIYKGDAHPVAAALSNLASCLDSLGRSADAEPLYRQAMEMSRRLSQGDHMYVAACMGNLGSVLMSLGRVDDAEPLLRDALAMHTRLARGADLPQLSQAMGAHAQALEALKHDLEAEPLYRDALAMSKRIYKGDHPEVAGDLNDLAAFLNRTGRTPEAVPLVREALEMKQRIYKGDHPSIAGSMDTLASMLETMDRAGEAEPIYRDALAMKQRVIRGDHPGVAIAMNNLANCLLTVGKLEEAQSLAEQAVAMAERVYPKGHPNTAVFRETLADIRKKLDAK